MVDADAEGACLAEEKVFESGNLGVVGENGERVSRRPFFIWTAVDMTSRAPWARAAR